MRWKHGGQEGGCYNNPGRPDGSVDQVGGREKWSEVGMYFVKRPDLLMVWMRDLRGMCMNFRVEFLYISGNI